MSELDPTPELPDNMPIREVRFPTRIKDALFAAGLKIVAEVREISDEALLRLPDFAKASVARLRETLGLLSTDGVRPLGKKAFMGTKLTCQRGRMMSVGVNRTSGMLITRFLQDEVVA